MKRYQLYTRSGLVFLKKNILEQDPNSNKWNELKSVFFWRNIKKNTAFLFKVKVLDTNKQLIYDVKVYNHLKHFDKQMLLKVLQSF